MRAFLPEVLSQEMVSIASIRAGGLEFVSFHLFNEIIGAESPPPDGNIYGFGTPAFRNVFQTTLETTKGSGLLFDFAVRANQGQGIPSVPEAPGLAAELRYRHQIVVGGERLPKGDSEYRQVLGSAIFYERA